MKLPTRTTLAAKDRSIASVPFVVVMTIPRPSTAARQYSAGEFPRSNPAMRTPLRSPPRRHVSPEILLRRRASATSTTGFTKAAPASRAVTIVVDALRTSTIIAIPPATDSRGISSGRQWVYHRSGSHELFILLFIPFNYANFATSQLNTTSIPYQWR